MNRPAQKVAILVEDLYQVLEVWYPLLRLREAGVPVVTIGTGTKQAYQSKEGYPITVDTAIQKVRAADFKAVIIPGGFAPDILRRYPEVVSFIRQIHEAGNVVAAICHGGWLLVSADIVRGKKATCFFAIKDDMIAAGARYVDEEVVVDGNIITSRKPEDLPLFVQEILTALKKGKEAR